MTEERGEAADERRKVIVRAALELLDRDGFERLSLRRLATHLGMHAPGLYWYFEGKQELVDFMAYAILTEGLSHVERPKAGETWEVWLVELACAIRRTLLSRRDGARVVAGAWLIRTGAITPVVELSLEVLEDAGFDRLPALGATMTVFRYAMGMALEEQGSPFGGPPDPAAAERFANRPLPDIDAEQWPRAADAFRLAHEKGVRDREMMFRWGAQMLVHGFAESFRRSVNK